MNLRMGGRQDSTKAPNREEAMSSGRDTLGIRHGVKIKVPGIEKCKDIEKIILLALTGSEGAPLKPGM